MHTLPSLTPFGTILIFILGGLSFLLIGLLAARILRPSKPNAKKLTSYESGEDAIGNAWNKFNIRYFTIALIFILFEVELVFLFPWATIFAHKELINQTNELWGWFSLLEMAIFVGILVLGLAYAWAKGYIDWVKPNAKSSDFKPVVPKSMYDKVNEKY